MRVIRSWVRVAAIAASLGVVSSESSAQNWMATLNGASESPANLSPGVGFASIVLSGNMLSINANFSGLLSLTAGGLPSSTTAAHIHCCTPVPFTGNIGVATQTPSFPGFPLGVNAGVFFNTYDMSLSTSYNATFLAANGGSPASALGTLVAGFNSGTTYFNIHTAAFPGGEIRGFIVAAPEPGSVLLVAAGLLALGAVGRRRIRK